MLFILFQFDSDRYALPARDVIEVLPLMTLKTLHGAPAGVAGLADYRGMAVPVIDLAAVLLGRPSARRVSTRLLVVRYPHPRGREQLLGLVVEKATETIAREPGDFRSTGVANVTNRFLGPVARDARGLIQRVDVQALLTAELRAALYSENCDDDSASAATRGAQVASGPAAP